MNDNGYINGYIERKKDGHYDGEISIEGISLSPIEATFFEEEGKNYLWLKRKQMLEYDAESQSYKTRHREPRWEAYLSKVGDGVIAYKGEFMFLKFAFGITAVWDKVTGIDKQRLNFFIERKPLNKQTIILNINERKRNSK